MIEELNKTVWATIKPSKIDGIGVFAIREIPQGTQIWAKKHFNVKPIRLTSFEGLHPAILELIKQRWPLAFQGDVFFSPNDEVRLASFMNHSDNYNYDPVTDRVICDIMEGEEITEDYRVIPNYQELFPFING